MNKKIRIICKRVSYCSMIDEDLFFEWLTKIPSISSFDGELDELYLYFERKVIPYKDLLELTGLFHRYKIAGMDQLQIFVNEKNKKRYAGNPNSYWHKKVFGVLKPTKKAKMEKENG